MVPAVLTWTGAVSSNFGDVGNWQDEYGVPWLRPVDQGDDLIFNGSVSNVDCNGLRGFDFDDIAADFTSIQVINNYSGTVTLAGEANPSASNKGVAVHHLTMASGTISQPVANAELFVLGSLNWTGGTLNSTSYTSAITVLGSGSVAPANAGTVAAGSSLVFSGSSETWFSAGIVELTNAATIVVEQLAFIGTQAQPQPGPKVTVKGLGEANKYVLATGGELNLDGWDVSMGLQIEGATVRAHGDKSKFTGRTSQSQFWAVHLKSGTLIIDNGTTLSVGDKVVRVDGGKLATKATAAANQGDATIEGALAVAGNTTEVVISDTTLNPAGVMGHKFAKLVVTENVTWFGGIYKPTVDGATGSTTADLWHCKKTFTVDTQAIPGSQPKLDPIVVNAPAGSMVSGQERGIMTADSGFVIQGNAPTFVVPNTWTLVQEVGNPSKKWSVRKT